MKHIALHLLLVCSLPSWAQVGLYTPTGTVVGPTTNPSTGNVGIGTSSPSAVLHLFNSSSSTYLNIDKPSTSSEGGIRFSRAGNTLFYLWNDDGTDALKIEAAGLTGESDGTPRMEFPLSNKNIHLALSGGNVGVGTASPQSTLDIRGNIVSETGANPIFYAGVGSSELNRYLLLLNSTGLHTASGLMAGGILIADSYTYASPGKNDLIVKGNVGIGTSSPDAKLAVSGQVHAQEVKVSVTVPGPDYVFEKDYKLTSLEEIKNYIDQNKHLPEVPSAKEMEKNGVQLGEMNMLLLKKIEELTLYVIEQNKKMEELKKEDDHAKERMELMQSEINRLKK
jgi:hypothetical protein